jgi:hypothetical protein
MASTTSITINCPDCGAPQQLTVHLINTVNRGRNELRIQLDQDQFTETFSQHVLTEPEKHPTLVIHTDEQHPRRGVPHG